jgi:hypothetical protein
MTEPKKESKKCKVTLDQVMAAIEADDCLGFCLACGEEAYNVEPDARRYTCESCGKPQVYGAEELLLMGVGICPPVMMRVIKGLTSPTTDSRDQP